MHGRMSVRLRCVVLALLAVFCQCLFSQQSATKTGAVPNERSPPESGHSNAVQAAVITAISALAGVLLKDLIFKIWEERREKTAALRAVYSRYGDPLSSSTVSLMWRLHEALELPGRGRFLKLAGLPAATNKYSTFGAYKKLSTLYRLAVLLGWIRACRREFSYLKVAGQDKAEPIDAAMAEFESALADGPAVEVERLEKLCTLWGLNAPADENRRSSAAVDLEAAIDEFMEATHTDEIFTMTDHDKHGLASCAASAITGAFKVQAVPSNVLTQTWARAVQIIDIKEAWIYRDWQSAIGDLMLRPVDNGDRRFDVISYGEFESICTTGTDEEKKWISRISAVFDGIDVSVRNQYDHRPDQLLAVMRATARLTRALSKCADNTSISEKSLELASKLSQ